MDVPELRWSVACLDDEGGITVQYCESEGKAELVRLALLDLLEPGQILSPRVNWIRPAGRKILEAWVSPVVPEPD